MLFLSWYLIFASSLWLNFFFEWHIVCFEERNAWKFHLHRDVLVYIILTLFFVLTFHISGLICCPVFLSSSAAVEVFNALATGAEIAFYYCLLLWYRISMLYKTSRFFGTRWHGVTKFLYNASDGKILDQMFKTVFNFDLLISCCLSLIKEFAIMSKTFRTD